MSRNTGFCGVVRVNVPRRPLEHYTCKNRPTHGVQVRTRNGESSQVPQRPKSHQTASKLCRTWYHSRSTQPSQNAQSTSYSIPSYPPTLLPPQLGQLGVLVAGVFSSSSESVIMPQS